MRCRCPLMTINAKDEVYETTNEVFVFGDVLSRASDCYVGSRGPLLDAPKPAIWS